MSERVPGHDDLPASPLAIAEALRAVRARLCAAGIAEAHLEAELLLAHVTGWSRAALHAHPERTLDVGKRATLAALVARRVAREPLAYLIGEAPFLDFSVRVDRRVLIPRPETELLVEVALDWARPRAVRYAADVGTGSGVIAIALARGLPAAYIYALDLQREALEVAAANAGRWQVLERVELIQSDLLERLPEPVDLVVANLPYIPSAEIAHLQPEVARFEPRVALDGGPDGLRLIDRLLAQLPAALRPGGATFLEVGAGQAAAVAQAAGPRFPDRTVRIWPDLAGIARVIGILPYEPAT